MEKQNRLCIEYAIVSTDGIRHRSSSSGTAAMTIMMMMMVVVVVVVTVVVVVVVVMMMMIIQPVPHQEWSGGFCIFFERTGKLKFATKRERCKVHQLWSRCLECATVLLWPTDGPYTCSKYELSKGTEITRSPIACEWPHTVILEKVLLPVFDAKVAQIWRNT